MFYGIYLDDNDGASTHLAGLSFLVDLAQTGPLSELLVGVDADQRNLVLVAEAGNELLILRLIAALGEDGEDSLSLVQSLAGLVDSVNESVDDKRFLQHFLEGGVHIHRSSNNGDSGHITVIETFLLVFMSQIICRKGYLHFNVRHGDSTDLSAI